MAINGLRRTLNIFIDKMNGKSLNSTLANNFSKNSLIDHKKKLNDIFLILMYKK